MEIKPTIRMPDNPKAEKQSAFLICPVRGHDPAELQHVVQQLETNWKIHWPPRDTDQDDPTGFKICCDNFDAILEADIVFLIWDGKSQGCLFDAGMTFALFRLFNKPIVIIDLPELIGSKSFQDMFTEWGRQCGQKE